ncbi:MAG: hypothetical protein EOM26_11425 [Alphaproteobacteria bacterium]|nr:hypothetical protein [Alphaproteobacteria bacterium]
MQYSEIMTDQPHELILDHLRAIRSDIAEMKADIHDLKTGQLSVREQLNSMQRDNIRVERALASVEHDIERIKTRLDLTE